MIELLTRLDVALWNVFFFVPPGPEEAAELLTADEHEQVFAKLYAASGSSAFRSKPLKGSTTSAISCSSVPGNRADA